MSDQLPQPGWYPNSQGQTQWWDGSAWGQLADHSSSQYHGSRPLPPHPGSHPVAPQYHYVSSAAKPNTHPFTWLSFASAAIALLSTLAAAASYIGTLYGFAYLAILASLVFGIIAIVQSRNKGLPIVATALAATGFVWMPILQFVIVTSLLNAALAPF